MNLMFWKVVGVLFFVYVACIPVSEYLLKQELEDAESDGSNISWLINIKGFSQIVSIIPIINLFFVMMILYYRLRDWWLMQRVYLMLYYIAYTTKSKEGKKVILETIKSIKNFKDGNSHSTTDTVEKS